MQNDENKLTKKKREKIDRQLTKYIEQLQA